MDFSKIKLFTAMKTKMSYLSERQDVLAQNIANVDTPGYRPRDLKKPDFESMAMVEAHRLQLRATHPNHREPIEKVKDFRAQEQRDTYEITPMRNQVVVEEQMMKVAETNLQYQATTNLYKKVANMFKTAIGNQ